MKRGLEWIFPDSGIEEFLMFYLTIVIFYEVIETQTILISTRIGNSIRKSGIWYFKIT